MYNPLGRLVARASGAIKSIGGPVLQSIEWGKVRVSEFMHVTSREMNRQAILAVLAQEDSLSPADVIETSGLGLKDATTAINDLVEQKLIKQVRVKATGQPLIMLTHKGRDLVRDAY